jgi:ABC-type nickel/cobalt efflux system permease component RcnA
MGYLEIHRDDDFHPDSIVATNFLLLASFLRLNSGLSVGKDMDKNKGPVIKAIHNPKNGEIDYRHSPVEKRKRDYGYHDRENDRNQDHDHEHENGHGHEHEHNDGMLPFCLTI